MPESFFHLSDLYDLYLTFISIKPFQVIVRDDDAGKAQLLCLQNTLFTAVDRTDFARQADLATHTNALFDTDIEA